MTRYELFKLLHVVGAMAWVGAVDVGLLVLVVWAMVARPLL